MLMKFILGIHPSKYFQTEELPINRKAKLTWKVFQYVARPVSLLSAQDSKPKLCKTGSTGETFGDMSYETKESECKQQSP